MQRFVWTCLAVLAVVTAVASWRYIFFTDLIAETGWGAHLANYPVATFLHFGLGPLALVLGIFQFLVPTRRNNPKRHRWVGYAYVSTGLMAGVASIPIATYTSVGIWGSVAFWVLAVFWVSFTVVGLYFALEGKIANHGRWMLRSYALTYSAVTLRIMLVSSEIMGLPFSTAYLVIVWTCWPINMIVVEVYLARKNSKRAPKQVERLPEFT